MNLNKTDPSEVYNILKNISKDNFFKFLQKSQFPSQLDLTINPIARKNLTIIFNKLDQHRGDKFICELKPNDQFKSSMKKKCHFPEVISRANTIKKIGADSVNGIVFLIALGNFKFIVKNAIAYNADPLDYEYHIQNILNPLRSVLPNYSLGYFYFNCKINPSLKLRSVILNEGLTAISASFEETFEEEIEDFNPTTRQKLSGSAIASKKTFEGWFSKKLQQLEYEGDVDEYISTYHKMLNLYRSLNFGNLCITRPERKVTQGPIKSDDHNLFIATEISSNPMALEDFCEKLNSSNNDETLINILIQIFAALHYGWVFKRFTHYDLHAGNILLTKLPTPMLFVYHFPGTKMPFVPVYTEYMATIIDFGRSYVDGKKFYFDIKDPKGKSPNYQFNEGSNLMPNRANASYDFITVIDACSRILSDKDKSKIPRFLRLLKIIKTDFKGKLDDGELIYPHTGGSTIKNNLDLIWHLYKRTQAVPKFPSKRFKKVLFSKTLGSQFIDIKQTPIFQKMIKSKNMPSENEIKKFFVFKEQFGGNALNITSDLSQLDMGKPRKKNNKPKWAKREGQKLLKKYRNMYKSKNSMDLDGGKKKRKYKKRKQKGGININNDIHLAVEKIQKI